MDDQYTERGRQLLRREAEAAANGLRIGDILHSDALDIELPGLAKRKGEGAGGGWVVGGGGRVGVQLFGVGGGDAECDMTGTAGLEMRLEGAGS